MADSENEAQILSAKEFTVLDSHIRTVVRDAVQEAIRGHILTPEESQFVKLALKREARREAFQTAIIEKSLIGLVFMVFTFLGLTIFEWAVKHGFKP